MLRIEDDVYFVAGVERSVLYDSRNGFIYHLDHEATRSLSSLLSSGDVDKCSGELCSLVGYLIDKKLLANNESLWDGDIQRLKITPKVSFAWIEITTSCNLKCIHCYEGDSLHNAAEMSIETFKRIVDELCDYGIRKVQLIGGDL